MTAVDPDAHSVPPPVADPRAERALTEICPYLAAADGGWRSAAVAREHRCGAVAPPAPLAAEKQRRLCLTADHSACATYEAARAARPIAHGRASTLPRPLARTTPVVLDHGRLVISMPAFRSDRSSAQVILVGLMAIAFAAIVFARFTGGGVPAGAVGASATPSATAPVGASPTVVGPTSAPTPTAAPDASTAPTERSGGSTGPATAAPSIPATRTYKVKAGDTIIGIAAKFGTTPKAIATLNGLADASRLRIGQVLKIP